MTSFYVDDLSLIRVHSTFRIGGLTAFESCCSVLDAFREFASIYKQRPVGFYPRQRIDHTFYIWFHVRRLRPSSVVETSVKWGHATFFIRHAAPQAKIVAFSPTGLQIKHWDRGTQYFAGPAYQPLSAPPGIQLSPYKELNETDWSIVANKNDSLVVFADDHDHWEQFQHMRQLGFRRAIFDANLAPLQGYHYTLKKICDETGGLLFKPWRYRDRQVIRSSRKSSRYEHTYVSLQQHQRHRQELLGAVQLYAEMPPLLFYPSLLAHTTFHLPTTTPGNRILVYLTVSNTALPLVRAQAEFDSLGLRDVPLREFGLYQNPAYVELKPR